MPSDRIDDLIASVTRRLRPDAELQMDVANELRAHLEDTVDAARAAGDDGDAALDAALKSFGDPDRIEAALFRANRRRMRLRAVARWAFRLIATPAALVLALWLTLDTVAFLRFIDLTGARHGVMRDLWRLAEHVSGRPDFDALPPKPDLTATERLWVDARPLSLADAEALARAYPDDPVCLAHLVGLLIEEGLDRPPKGIQRGLDIAERGVRLEPDNAYWDYCEAILLMRVSGASALEADPALAYPVSTEAGTYQDDGFRLVLHDRALFERGMAAYRRGLVRPRYESHDMAFTRRKLALRRRPEDAMDQMQFILLASLTPLPTLPQVRDLTRCSLGYARVLIDEGRSTEAAALVRSAAIPGTQMAADAQLTIELLVGSHLRQTAFNMGAALYDRIGMAEEAQAAREQAAADARERDEAIGGAPGVRAAHEAELRRYSGLIGPNIYGPVPTLKSGLIEPMARAERLFMERAVLGALCLALLAFALWFAAATCVAAWRHRADRYGPKLFFIGWRRLVLVLLEAIVAPLTAYAVWTRGPWGSVHYGLGVVWRRGLLEMGFTAVVVLELVLMLAFLSSRARCREAGLAPPPRRGGLWATVLLEALVVVSTGAFLWLTLPRRATSTALASVTLASFVGMVGATLALVVVALRRTWRRSPEAVYARSVRRGMLPALIAALIVLGLVGTMVLATAERAAVHTLHRRGAQALFTREVDSTTARSYKQYVTSLPASKGVRHGAD